MITCAVTGSKRWSANLITRQSQSILSLDVQWVQRACEKSEEVLEKIASRVRKVYAEDIVENKNLNMTSA